MLCLLCQQVGLETGCFYFQFRFVFYVTLWLMHFSLLIREETKTCRKSSLHMLSTVVGVRVAVGAVKCCKMAVRFW